MNRFQSFLAMISSEFQRFVMENEGIAEKIPGNALIVFEVAGEEDFNRWHREISLKNRQANQPIRVVQLKGWRAHSSIGEITITEAAA
jgi:hypothetical protein